MTLSIFYVEEMSKKTERQVKHRLNLGLTKNKCLVLRPNFRGCFDFGAHFRTVPMKNGSFLHIHVKLYVISLLPSKK